MLAGLNAKYIHSNPALYSLRAYACKGREEEGNFPDIVIREFTINQLPGDIIRDLYLEKPDLLAFSCYIWNIGMILRAADSLHKILPDVPIWLGGPEVSFEDASFLHANPALTGLLLGEGECTFRRLSEAYARYWDGCALSLQKLLEGIPGILFRCGDGVVQGPALTKNDLPRMDDLPFLYENTDLFQNRIPYYESSRGCPFSCSYCLSALEGGIRLRSMELVFRDLSVFLAQGVKQVKFVDRTFNANHAHAMAIWQYIRDHDNQVTNFHFELEANLLSEEELALLTSLRPGLVQVEIGVQSANPRTLQAVSRSPRLDKIEQAAAALVRSGNIHVHLDLIAGLPYEDYESFRASFARVYAMHPHELQLGFLKLLKGSIIRSQAREYGIVSQTEAPYEILQTRWLSFADILQLKLVEEMLEVYYNSHQFSSVIRELEADWPDPMALYEAMGAYYRQKGLLGQAHSRYARFQILLDFTALSRPQKLPLMRRLAVFDLYLRENAKSRPAWAPEQKPEMLTEADWRERVRAFYRQEEKHRTLLPNLSGRDSRSLAGMTHLEYFLDDPRPRAGQAKAGEKNGCLLLFDYSSRNPVTGDARTVDVTELFAL